MKLNPKESYYKLEKNCEYITQYNFITKFLHKNKYQILINHINKKFKKKKLNILDLGCGTCNSFKILNEKFLINYTGIENETRIVNLAKERYDNFDNFNIINCDNEKFLTGKNINNYDLIICFDTLEHMNLNSAMIVLKSLKKMNFKFLYINIPNELGPSILIKNFGSMIMGYQRHKEYSLLETIYASFFLLNKIPIHNQNHKGFDWRKIRRQLYALYDIKIHSNPFKFLPSLISPSIFFICKK